MYVMVVSKKIVMKLLIHILIVLLLLGCKQTTLKQINEDDLIDRIIQDKMPEPESIKDIQFNGHQISLDSLKKLERTEEYFEDFFVNEEGEIVKVVVRDKTPEDEIFIAKINRRFNEGPPLVSVDIDCNDKVNILQRVYERDQGMRTDGSGIDSDIDHQNLEIVVSFIEKCGMPTLSEVDRDQMAGIWLVLQHAPAEYQSKYIPMLEESAKNGDISWSTIALMKDRALMYEGKPQVYGSQISDGELYDLFEPEYVNQRRAEIGMQPLEDYLNRFGLEFNVDQKVK